MKAYRLLLESAPTQEAQLVAFAAFDAAGRKSKASTSQRTGVGGRTPSPGVCDVAVSQ